MALSPDHYVFTAPLVHGAGAKIMVVAAAYALTLGLSGRIVRYFVVAPNAPPLTHVPGGPRFNPSTVIGKCENLIVLTFMLAGEQTGIAVIFAAKALVRTDAIKKNPGFFLGGTMVNLVWALGIGIIARLLIAGA